MVQQINLYNPELRPKRETLTAAMMAKGMMVFALMMAGYGWIVVQQTEKLAQQREEWVRRAQGERMKLVQVTQQYPAKAPSETLAAEMTAFEQKVREREAVLQVLKSGAIGTGGGFSDLMQAFARQGVEGLWLTGVSAGGKGQQMRISGRAMSPDLIPRYIGRLSREAALRGRTFTAFEVSQPKPQAAQEQAGGNVAPAPGYIEFMLSSEKPAAGDAGPAGSSSLGGKS